MVVVVGCEGVQTRLRTHAPTRPRTHAPTHLTRGALVLRPVERASLRKLVLVVVERSEVRTPQRGVAPIDAET